MMKQEEIVQETKDNVVEERKEEEKKIEKNNTDRLQAFMMRLFGDPKQKGQMIYSAIFFFVLGLLSLSLQAICKRTLHGLSILLDFCVLLVEA